MKSAFIIVCGLCAVFICSTIIFWEKNSQKSQQIQQQLAEIAKLRAALIPESKSEVQKNQTTLVCGIYECEKPGQGQLKMDLRSDGTAISSLIWDNGQEFNRKRTTWTLNEDKVQVGNSNFKIEGDDLIDSQGYRWLRVH